MKPVDYRNETWKSVQRRVSALRLAALHAWRTHGPGTTREVAHRAGIDLLTFRPRTTELYQLGYVILAEPAANHAREGKYRALTDDQAEALFLVQQQIARTHSCQPELKLAFS